jgi:hypothetical protein
MDKTVECKVIEFKMAFVKEKIEVLGTDHKLYKELNDELELLTQELTKHTKKEKTSINKMIEAGDKFKKMCNDELNSLRTNNDISDYHKDILETSIIKSQNLIDKASIELGEAKVYEKKAKMARWKIYMMLMPFVLFFVMYTYGSLYSSIQLWKSVSNGNVGNAFTSLSIILFILVSFSNQIATYKMVYDKISNGITRRQS